MKIMNKNHLEIILFDFNFTISAKITISNDKIKQTTITFLVPCYYVNL